MEILAKVLQSLGVQSGVSKNGNPWQKAEIVVEVGYDSQYPKKVALSNMKNAEEFARLPIGSIAKFHIDIESREYQGRYFTNVSAYKWELQGQQAPPQQQYAQPQHPYSPSPQTNGYQQPPKGFTQPPQQQSEEDLPF